MASSRRRQQFDAARRHAGNGWAAFVAITALVAGVAESVKGLTVGKETIGERFPSLLLWIVLVALLIAFVEGVRQIVQRERWHLKGVRTDPLVDVAHFLALGVHRLTSIPVEDIGVSIFVVRRDVWALSLRKSLFRVHKFRIRVAPASDVDWTEGKGAVGLAWRDRRPAHQDWGALRIRCPDALTEAKFRRMPKKDRSEFSFEEYQQVMGKFAEVVAVPAIEPRSGVLRAIVSVDTAKRSRADSDPPMLRHEDVLEALEEAAARVISTGTR